MMLVLLGKVFVILVSGWLYDFQLFDLCVERDMTYDTVIYIFDTLSLSHEETYLVMVIIGYSIFFQRIACVCVLSDLL